MAYFNNISSYLRTALGLINNYSTVNKFGEATDCDNGVATDIYDGADGSLGPDIWVPPTTARIHDIVSSSGNDTSAGTGARTLRVWGLQDWDTAESSEDIILNGTTNVPTVNSYVIIHRMQVLTWGANGLNAGDITATAQTDGTLTAAILTGNNQTQMCIYGVPSTQNLRVSQFGCAVVRSGGSAVTLEGEILLMTDPNTNAANNTAWTNKENFTAESGLEPWEHKYKEPKKFDGPCILKIQVTSDSNNATAIGYFDGTLYTT